MKAVRPHVRSGMMIYGAMPMKMAAIGFMKLGRTILLLLLYAFLPAHDRRWPQMNDIKDVDTRSR